MIDDANHALSAAVVTARRQTLLSKLLYGARGLVLGRASCPLR